MSGKNFMSYGDADTILTEFSNDIKSRVSTKANQGLTAQQMANAKANIDIDKVPNVATNDQTPTFLEESSRVNIASGDKLSLIFGKIKKFFSDLKTVAFTGSYNDLSDKIAFDNMPTQNSNNAVKSGGVFNSMAVFKYDSVNKRGYFVGGSAFGGNIDSSPTAGSNNAVASGGTKTYVDSVLDNSKIAIIEQTFSGYAIDRAWGSVYESAQVRIDISSLNLSSPPKAVYLTTKSSTASVLYEMGTPTAGSVPFWFVRPNNNGTNITTTVSALVVY